MFDNETNLPESNCSTKKRPNRKKVHHNQLSTPVTINPHLIRFNNEFPSIPYRIYDTKNNNLPPVSTFAAERSSIEHCPFFNISRQTTNFLPPVVPYFLRSPTGQLVEMTSRASKTIPFDVHRFVNVSPASNPPVSNEKSTKKVEKKAKNQWKNISRRNKAAVLKFLMRKRKQQIEAKNSQTNVRREEKLEEKTSPIDLIVPNLKVSFDSNDQIEFISLYYHRRKSPDETKTNDECSRQLLKNSENKLDLLLEAVEFIETQKDKRTLSSDSNE